MINYILTANTKKHMFAIIPVYLMGMIWGGKILSQKMIKEKLEHHPPHPLDSQDIYVD